MAEAVRVVRGEPSAEQLAVVVALVTASAGRDTDDAAPLRGRWNDRAVTVGAPLRPGRGAWRAAARRT